MQDEGHFFLLLIHSSLKDTVLLDNLQVTDSQHWRRVYGDVDAFPA